jgi:hypothetical protein
MFPNFRLLVVATLASIVLLICGLGMFATVRVGHAPLLRPVVATVSPQALADNMASGPLAFAPSESFHRRFEMGGTGRSDAVAAFTRFLARRENVESPPAASPAAPEPGAIAAKEQPTAIEMPKDVPVAATTATDMPAAKAVPIATDAAVASLPGANVEPAPPPEAATPPAVTPTAAIEAAPTEAVTPAPEAATPPAVTPAAAVEASPPQPAEPAPVQAASVPAAEPEQQPASVKPAAIAVPDSKARKTESNRAGAEPAHAAAKPHRKHRAATETAMQEQQPTFVTAPPDQQWQMAQPRPAKARRRSVAVSKTDNTATGIGGPFVGLRQ